MEMSTRMEIAETLRHAADGIIPEESFWERLRRWRGSVDDPRILIVWEEADHYWANFHERNLLGIHVKPHKSQLEHGRRTLRMLAQAFEEDWDEARIEEALSSI